MNDILTLIKEVSAGADEYGDAIVIESKRDVFIDKNSIGTKEFYQATAAGLSPELRFTLADYLDYEGEKLVEYEGVRYKVLKTYQNGQKLELTAYRGIN